MQLLVWHHVTPCAAPLQVAASKASTIIVLHPEHASSANAEAIKVSVAMSLTALGATGQQRVVVQGMGYNTTSRLLQHSALVDGLAVCHALWHGVERVGCL